MNITPNDHGRQLLYTQLQKPETFNAAKQHIPTITNEILDIPKKRTLCLALGQELSVNFDKSLTDSALRNLAFELFKHNNPNAYRNAHKEGTTGSTSFFLYKVGKENEGKGLDSLWKLFNKIMNGKFLKLGSKK
jgi:hypothetical protein